MKRYDHKQNNWHEIDFTEYLLLTKKVLVPVPAKTRKENSDAI